LGPVGKNKVIIPKEVKMKLILRISKVVERQPCLFIHQATRIIISCRFYCANKCQNL
jgi:hypothetical protein